MYGFFVWYVCVVVVDVVCDDCCEVVCGVFGEVEEVD